MPHNLEPGLVTKLARSPCVVVQGAVVAVAFAYHCCVHLISRSIRQSIRTREPNPTSGSEESTVQIDVEEMKMGVDGVSLRVYDCAGQVIVLWFRSSRAGIAHVSTPDGSLFHVDEGKGDACLEVRGWALVARCMDIHVAVTHV